MDYKSLILVCLKSRIFCQKSGPSFDGWSFNIMFIYCFVCCHTLLSMLHCILREKSLFLIPVFI